MKARLSEVFIDPKLPYRSKEGTGHSRLRSSPISATEYSAAVVTHLLAVEIATARSIAWRCGKASSCKEPGRPGGQVVKTAGQDFGDSPG
jgi:hypothetical protein